jgi:hypothetical protein
LFVAANCPSTGGQLVWETWIEQEQLYTAPPPGAESRRAAKRLHGSPLAHSETARQHNQTILLAPNSECNTMTAPPPNVVPGATVCEEVHINPAAQAFIVSGANPAYQFRPGQTVAAQQGANIQFPWDAVEVKVDWIPASDFKQPFLCSAPPPGVHVETIDGTCYAMAGFHIESKLLPDWVWATFEPQSLLTNPLRCITFGACNDPWGSNPAISNGAKSGPPPSNGFTQQTPQLAALTTAAGLAPEFANYRMDGAQINFLDSHGKPTYLGNSIIEGENVGLKHNQVSCITCHSVSSIKNDGTDGFCFFQHQAYYVGMQVMPSPNWIARDFVWSLGLAQPPGPTNGTCP